MNYYLLTDNDRRGTIVRTEGRIHHRYDKIKGWIRSGVLMEYFNDDSPYYDSYNEITEEEAMKLITSK